jgi:hypothetical protein
MHDYQKPSSLNGVPTVPCSVEELEGLKSLHASLAARSSALHQQWCELDKAASALTEAAKRSRDWMRQVEEGRCAASDELTMALSSHLARLREGHNGLLARHEQAAQAAREADVARKAASEETVLVWRIILASS